MEKCLAKRIYRREVKTLKFASHLVREIQKGRKTSTWRVFDEKDLQVGDRIQLVNKETAQIFAEADIVRVHEKNLEAMTEDDLDGHESYASPEEMLKSFQAFYGDKVTMNTPVKIINFSIVRFVE